MDRRSHSITGVLPLVRSFNGRHLQGQSILEEMASRPRSLPWPFLRGGVVPAHFQTRRAVVVLHVQQGHGSFAFEPSIMSRHQAYRGSR